MRLVADTHVHCYPNYALSDWLHSGRSGLLEAAPAGEDLISCLCWTRTRKEISVEEFESTARKLGYTVHEVLPRRVLRVETGDPKPIFVVLSAQHTSAEGIEILTVGSADAWDNLPLDEIIARAAVAAWATVLPWSPGKWWGRRGQIISQALLSRPHLCAGDIAMRPEHLRTLPVKNRILSGSDPLPLPGEERRVGRVATIFSTPILDPASEESWRNCFNGDTRATGSRDSLATAAGRWLRLFAASRRRLTPSS